MIQPAGNAQKPTIGVGMTETVEFRTHPVDNAGWFKFLPIKRALPAGDRALGMQRQAT
ncbi:MAG: hypothetical protein RQ741_14345 [Wenzhouxiangellaceae bacterium]|nr:hypothetical protein [Wenzhouxiangellaceae bacterium]